VHKAIEASLTPKLYRKLAYRAYIVAVFGWLGRGAPPPKACFVDLVRAERPEISPLSYFGYYEVASAEDPIGNDIGVNHDNGVKHLVIGDGYGGGSVIKPFCSSPQPNQVNNDNVAKCTLAWPKLKPIDKVIGTTAWRKTIDIVNARLTPAKHCGGGGDSANRINIANSKSTSTTHCGCGGDSANRINIANAKSISVKHCGGVGDSANRINIANAKTTSTKHCDGGDDSANRINIANSKSTSVKHYGSGDSAHRITIANAKSTSAKHCGGGGDSANRISIVYAKSTSAKHCGGGGDSANMINIANSRSTSAKHYGDGDSASSVAGDNGMAHLTDVDACLPFWVMKTGGRPPPELNITSNNSWVDEEACIISRGSLSTAALACDLNRANNAPEGRDINNPIDMSAPSKYCRATVDNQRIAFACVARAQVAYKSRFDTDKENSFFSSK
jgi:hypothetical protein